MRRPDRIAEGCAFQLRPFWLKPKSLYFIRKWRTRQDSNL
tara:strand:+ start:4628 stop:4747 length:120 start_codon:yes stop_codon:yes gene_type:complete